MRISQEEIGIIKKLAKQAFGEGTEVLLFGSRLSDQKRGGDIDLMIRSKDRNKLTLVAKIDFLVSLKSQIGEQKIDVVLDNNSYRGKSPFYQSIIQQAVEL